MSVLAIGIRSKGEGKNDKINPTKFLALGCHFKSLNIRNNLDFRVTNENGILTSEYKLKQQLFNLVINLNLYYILACVVCPCALNLFSFVFLTVILYI